MSESTVGRILKVLFQKGLIQKSLSAPRRKKKRNFRNSHVTSRTYKDYKKMAMGERVQIDHMTVTKNLRIWVSAAHLDGKYTSFENATPAGGSFTENKTERTPERSFSLEAEAWRPISEGELVAYGDVIYSPSSR